MTQSKCPVCGCKKFMSKTPTTTTMFTSSSAGMVKSVLKKIWMMTSAQRSATPRKPFAMRVHGMISSIKSSNSMFLD